MIASNYNDPFKPLFVLILLGAMALAALFMLSGCKTTEPGALRKVAKVAYYQPQVLSEFCGDKYPVRIYDSTRIEYRKGDTVTKRDTVTVVDTVNKTIFKYIYNTVVDTFYRDVNKQAESTAKTDTYAKENTSLREDNAVLKDKVKSLGKTLGWICLIGGIAVLAWVVWLVIKFIK